MNEHMRALVESSGFRTLQIAIMLDTFARALRVEPPRLPAHPANALRVFAVFTADCAQAATLPGNGGDAPLQEALYREALELGQHIRRLPVLRDADPFELVQMLYRNIGISMNGALPGEIEIPRCYFAQHYSPRECRFMSAFDRGIIEGITGGGVFAFTERITEGAPCCRARQARQAQPGREACPSISGRGQA